MALGFSAGNRRQSAVGGNRPHRQDAVTVDERRKNKMEGRDRHATECVSKWCMGGGGVNTTGGSACREKFEYLDIIVQVEG